MSPARALSAATLAMTAFLALACGNGGQDEQPDIRGIWGRQTDDGIWVVREFLQGDEFAPLGDRVNDNYAYADGEAPLLYNKGLYEVSDETDFGDVVADDVLTLYVLHDNGIVPGNAEGSRLSTIVDRVLHVDDQHLSLEGVYDTEPVEFDRFDDYP